MLNANKKEGVNKIGINWYPGHMAKTKRELKENMHLVDVVYEVIDARIPISSKIKDIDDIIKEKPKILVVTKYDLCDKKVTDELLKKYYKNYIVVVCNLMNNTGINKIIEETKKISVSINREREKKGLKPRRVRVSVIGIPNVGKSTLINRLVGSKAAPVGDKPGVTKNISWIRINNNIELMDSPGILWPKLEKEEQAYNLAAFSSIKEELLDKESIANYIIDKLNKLYPEYLINRYSLNHIDIDTIYDDIAFSKKMYLKGGRVDYDKVCTRIMNDLKSGAFGCITFDRSS